MRVVVCAANRSKVTGKIIAGPRHWDMIMRQQVQFSEGERKMPDEWRECDQGFIDQFGVWMDRMEAWRVAERAGQIIRQVSTQGILYSENLY